MEVKLRVADPAGNITIFVTSPVERNLYAKVANELLAIKEFRGEQVGFIERHEDGSSHMEMMGGEFCGNATRSFGYLLGKEQESKDAYKKTVTVDVSGSSEKLDVEVDYEAGTSKTMMPLPEKIEEVEARNLSDSRIEENKVKELNQLSISYNKMLDRLSESFEMQRQFTANAAHELRTPLAVMQAQLDLYHTTGHPATDACTEKTIQMVTDQNERLSKMVKTLLDMSELQTVARDEKIEVDALVEEVLADLDPLAEEKNVILESVCDAVTMMGSDILIYRVVYNLVENAIKYNNPGGKVQVTVCSDKEQICIQVMDNGSGIPADMKERVFEPFFRVDKSRSRALGGVGLGLALVREIVRVHDGAIRVLDNSNGGTTFEILFPETV